MRFRKDLACFLVMILTISVVLWLGEIVLAEGVSANTMSVSENTLTTQEVKENNVVSFAADDIANGTDGNITWAIDVDGKLVVNGSGDFSNGRPWWEYRSSITSAVVEITGMTDASYLFDGYENLIDVDLSGFDTSNVVNMKCMFNECSNLTSIKLDGLDTSKVTDMNSMFAQCSNLMSLDLSSFDTSNVTNMWDMFSGCRNLTNIKLDGFNTSKVTDMCSMFSWCSNLISLDLSGFDTSNVTRMCHMFVGCENLTSLNLSGFDTSNVTDMQNMFSICSNLSKLDLSGFDTLKVTNTSYMFSDCENLASLNLSGFDTSNVIDMRSMFEQCKKLTDLDLSRFDTSNVTDMSHMFSDCNNLSKLDLSGFDTFNVTNMWSMFNACNNLSVLDLSNFNTLNVTDMIAMFFDCSNLTNLNLDGFDTSNVKNMSYMFSGCSSLNKLDLSGFNTSNVTNMLRMFYDCENLKSLDLSGFDTSNVVSMSWMFSGCSNLSTLDLTSFITSNVTSMDFMFDSCSNLENLDLSTFDTLNVTDMGVMFKDCSNLSTLDLTSFDTSNVTNMTGMFQECSNLRNLDLNNFDTSNVIYIESMFSNCSNLSNLDLTSFIISNITSMDYMFAGCSNLKNLDLSTFDTSNITHMRGMFENCSNLSVLDLSNFNTINVTNMDSMFKGCNNLRTLNLTSFDTSNVTDMDSMFFECNNLKNLDLSTFDTSNVIRINGIFGNCNSLISINTPYNLIISVVLPYDETSVWCLEDGTEVTELPQNLDHSVLLIKKTIQTSDNPIGENDQWFQVTGVANDNNSTYIVKNSNQFVLDTLFDTLYNNTYQTLFINDKTADLSKLVPVFSVKGSIKAYVQGEEQISGESIQDFSGGPVAYRASNGDETREYLITFVKKESGPKLFVNGPSNREVYLTDYFNNIHDILIANIGDETLTGIKVELLNAAHVKLDDAATTGLGNNNTLSAFTKIPSSGESVSVMTNLGKIRLLPDGEGEIQGTLVISADGQAPVYIELSGYSSNPKITTTTTDLNMEDVVRVKYVPYSYTVETNNIDTENTITFSLEEGRLAEGLQIYPATGEIYGVPVETGEFPIKVKATYSRPEYLPSYADIILTVKDNTDGNVYNASDNGYELIRPVGKATSSGSNDFVLTRKGNQLFVSAGPYHEFVDFWLNGQRLIEGEDYTKESGSTRITVRAQTFINKTDTEGTNTFAAEFRTAGDSRDNLRRTAQNFRINFKKGSGSKSRSDSDERTVATMAAVSSKVSFAMRLVNPASLPLSGLTIEIHSTPKVSQTNQNGMATFYDIESGSHTLFVKDKDGNILASTDFEILFGDATKLQNMQLTVKSGSRFTLDAQLDGNVLTFVNLQEGDAYRILSANTADDTNIAIWFVLMFVSCGMGFGIYRQYRRRKAF